MIVFLSHEDWVADDYPFKFFRLFWMTGIIEETDILPDTHQQGKTASIRLVTVMQGAIDDGHCCILG